MNQANRIVLNTIAQYVKIIIGAIIMLYSTRLVFSELGTVDYGIYSLIGSVLIFMSFLNISLSKSTQRFLSFSMGKNDIKEQKIILYNSIVLHAITSLFTLLFFFLLESIVFDYFVDIQSDRIESAIWLYRFMALGVVFTIMTTPFNAVFISHENIVFVSILYIFTSIFKLISAIILVFIVSFDKLIVYGSLMCSISIIEFLIYFMYSRRKYIECKNIFSRKYFDKKILKSILAFSGWNLYGTICIIGRSQGYAFVINRLVGITANASYGIASQISNQINNLVYSASNALSPVITKSEGGKNRAQMIYYSLESSKFSFLFYSLIAIPFVFEINPIIKIWLGDNPLYSNYFTISIVLASLFDSFASGLRIGILAIGKIKIYTLCFYTIKILSLPFSILCYKIGLDLKYIFLPYILSELIGSIITVYVFKKYTGMAITIFVKRCLLNVMPSLLGSFFSCLFMNYCIVDPYLHTFLSFFVSISVGGVLAFRFALNNVEKKYLLNLFAS